MQNLLDVTDLLIAIQTKVQATHHRSPPYTQKDRFIQAYFMRELLFELKQNRQQTIVVRNTEALADFFLWQTLCSLESHLNRLKREDSITTDPVPFMGSELSARRNKALFVYEWDESAPFGFDRSLYALDILHVTEHVAEHVAEAAIEHVAEHVTEHVAEVDGDHDTTRPREIVIQMYDALMYI